MAAERTVPNAERLLAAARAAGIEVIHTIIRSLTVDGRDRSLDHKLTPIHLSRDDPAADPIAALAPRGDEMLLPKTSSGVFNSTTLDYVLRNLRAGLDGILRDRAAPLIVAGDPAAMAAEERASLGLVRLPETLEAALAALEADRTAMGWLPPLLAETLFGIRCAGIEATRGMDAAALCDLFKRLY